MKLSDQMVFSKALQAPKLPEGQTPIAISALETRQSPNDVQALREITIRMYETHRVNMGNSDVFNMARSPDASDHPDPISDGRGSGNEPTPMSGIVEQLPGEPTCSPGEIPEDLEEFEWADLDGATYLVKPKRAPTSRNQPGRMITATRGSIANFKGYQNGKSTGKGKGRQSAGRIRCGASDHHWRQCPFP